MKYRTQRRIELAVAVLVFVATLVLVLLSIGCATPADKEAAAKKRVDDTKAALTTNIVEQVRHGVALVKAAEHSLAQNPEPSRFENVARMTLDRADLAFTASGITPDSARVLELQRMVDGLLSTNVALRLSASNILAKSDAQLAASEARESALNSKLGALQRRLDEVNAENAALASTWVRLKRIFWWIVWGVVGVFVFRIIGALVPPPYNSAFHIVDFIAGGIGKLVMSVFPKAREAAGVVSTKTHELTEETLRRVALAIDDVKKQGAAWDSNPLKAALKNHTDEAVHRPVIESVLKSP